LVAGGQDYRNNSIRTAEVWDPSTGLWTIVGRLHQPRDRHTAARLPDGRVLVAGGEDYQGSETLASAEIFDPATSVWATTGNLVTGREQDATATLLDGMVMVAGGYDQSSEKLGSAGLFSA
jgi:N-acetylneuraminic acid mutarotase